MSLKNNPVYQPREDSWFLQKWVKKLAKGSVIDIGTGTGIQAFSAAQKKEVSSVIGVDINPKAISYSTMNSKHEKIKYLVSDMFEKINQDFDTIIFNPPYLLNHPEIKDLALDGGPTGLEVTARFVKQSGSHLKQGGIILVLVSNHVDVNKFEKISKEENLRYKILDKLKMDFEILYCYKLTK